jgi:hypothetical protein
MKDIHRLKLELPTIEKEISTFMASILSSNPEIATDDEFKQDLLEGSTDVIEIIDRILINIYINTGYIDGIKTARARLDDRLDRLETRNEVFRALIKRLMDAAQTRKINAPSGTVSIGVKPPSVEIVDEGLIPEKFMRITKAPSKTLIGNALKAGEDVPGTRLNNGGETLTIR